MLADKVLPSPRRTPLIRYGSSTNVHTSVCQVHTPRYTPMVQTPQGLGCDTCKKRPKAPNQLVYNFVYRF